MPPLLAIDIGGTKTLAALVDADRVLGEREMPTPRLQTAERWCGAVADLARDWRGGYGAAGVAVTGLVDEDRWSALNPAFLPVPGRFPLVAALRAELKVPVRAVNDAQAAAWGEHRFGAGAGRDLFYMTISTGIGGGAEANGRLVTGRNGLAGHIGQLRLGAPGDQRRSEDLASGSGIAAAARAADHAVSARLVFAEAERGAAWAQAIIDASAAMAARLAHTIQFLYAPELIVIGGGVGLASGYIGRIRSLLAELSPAERPEVAESALGKHAGVIGAADLARSLINDRGGTS